MLRKTKHKYNYNNAKQISDERLKNICFELDSISTLIDGRLSELKSSEEVNQDIVLRIFVKSFAFILRQLLELSCNFMHYKDKNKYPKDFTNWYNKYNDPKYKNDDDWIIKDFHNIIIDQSKSHWFRFYRNLIKLDYPFELNIDNDSYLKVVISYKSTYPQLPEDIKKLFNKESLVRHSINFDSFIFVFESIKVWILRSQI